MLPKGCNSLGYCNPAVASQPSSTSYAAQCDTETSIATRFDLPATGDIVVPISLP
jgi:hypothetical protein